MLAKPTNAKAITVQVAICLQGNWLQVSFSESGILEGAVKLMPSNSPNAVAGRHPFCALLHHMTA